ncbi:adenylate/guanylate cyclase domain-containing protein [Aestuariispira insulae]|uniref:Adenylate cyclase n=1 Tax=Aestuariispira insulae TaxID=1461337 RepID=A0A3D9H3W0_9PROT|nr:adenylate/guanylate cyclase domain-containing protein [Aestuariispira insulae]RED44179.1 adenylate cyclase [Aestuariispira insulae]
MKHPFYVKILVIFSLTTFLLASALIYLGYSTGLGLRNESTAQLITHAEESLERYVTARFHAGSIIEMTLAQVPETEAALDGNPDAAEIVIRALTPVFANFQSMTGAYLAGRARPHLYIARIDRLPEDHPIRIIAPADSLYAVERVVPIKESHKAHWIFLDEQIVVTAMTDLDDKKISPESMDWFHLALERGQSILTPPHIFSHTGQVGMTVATPLTNGQDVIAVNFSLPDLSNLLGSIRLSPRTFISLASEDGVLLHRTDKQEARVLPQSSGALERAIESLFKQNAVGKARIVKAAGEDHMVYIGRLRPEEDHNVYLTVSAPMSELNKDVDSLLIQSLIIAALIVAASLIFVVSLSRLISAPISQVAHIAGQIARLDFSSSLDIQSRISEIAQLSSAMKRMQEGLTVFGRYVPRQLVQKIMSAPESSNLGGESREISIMFTDVRGFTSFAEKLPSDKLLRMTSEYFEVMTGCIMNRQGIVDKFIGDAVMAFWNAPEENPDHVAHACEAALDAQAALQEFNRKQAAAGQPEYCTRFGLNVGECAIGNVGSSDRMNYTPFGSVVNMASRIEGINKHYGTQILVTEEVRDRVRDRFLFRPIDQVIPKGASIPIILFELLGRSDDAGKQTQALLRDWQMAYDALQAGRPAEALNLFEAIEKTHPEDPALPPIIARCRQALEPED